jgi:L-threonate 2-dehydrogenase
VSAQAADAGGVDLSRLLARDYWPILSPPAAVRAQAQEAGRMYRVGMIGLGKMGLPIARNLIERGFEVTGYRRQATPDLAAAGGIAVGSAAAAAAHADVLLSILPGAADVEQAICGPDGTLAALRPGTVHLEMSTIDVARKRRVAEAVRVRGGDLLDCPISGSPGMVGPRLATTFASGDRASVDRVAAVLDAISGPWVYAGPFGAGAALKYIANLLLAAHTVAAAEAIVLARSAGLDLELVQRTLDSSIGSSAIWKQRGPVMRDRAWSPAPGPIDTLAPILDQIEDYAAAGVPTPVFSSAKAVFDAAARDGWGHLDIASVHDQLAGLRPGDPLPGDSPSGDPPSGRAAEPAAGPAAGARS